MCHNAKLGGRKWLWDSGRMYWHFHTVSYRISLPFYTNQQPVGTTTEELLEHMHVSIIHTDRKNSLKQRQTHGNFQTSRQKPSGWQVLRGGVWKHKSPRRESKLLPNNETSSLVQKVPICAEERQQAAYETSEKDGQFVVRATSSQCWKDHLCQLANRVAAQAKCRGHRRRSSGIRCSVLSLPRASCGRSWRWAAFCYWLRGRLRAIVRSLIHVRRGVRLYAQGGP